MDDLSLSRMAELELLALRALLPRILATVLCPSDKARGFFLDDDAQLDDIATFAQTDEEASFLTNYQSGILRDARLLLEEYEQQLIANQQALDEASVTP